MPIDDTILSITDYRGSRTDKPDWKGYQRQSRLLEQWRTLYFDGLATIIRAHLGDPMVSGDRLRFPPVIRRQSKDEAAQYVLAPTRTFSVDGQPLSPAQDKALRRLYRDLRVDQFLQDAQEKCIPQNHVLMCLVPDRKRPRRGRLRSFLAYEAKSIQLSDPLETDLWYADRITLESPWSSNEKGCQMGTLVLTPTSGYIEGPEGERVGLYSLDSLGHRFSGVPVVGVRLEEGHHKGWWWPTLSEDLYALQIALAVGYTDAEDLAREYAPGLQILSGFGAAEMAKTITRGPRNLQVFDTKINDSDNAGGANYEYHQTSPGTEQYLAVLRQQLSVAASYRFGSPDGLRGDSGDAKEVERDDQMAERLRSEAVWREAEQSLCKLVIEWHNTYAALQLPVNVDVDVRYNYPQPRRNALQEAQTAAILASMGAVSIIDLVETGGVQLSHQEKLDLVARNRAEYRVWRDGLGDHVPVGLDTSATFMGLGPSKSEVTTTPAPAPGGESSTPDPEGGED